MTDPGEQREQFYLPPGAVVEPGVASGALATID